MDLATTRKGVESIHCGAVMTSGVTSLKGSGIGFVTVTTGKASKVTTAGQ